jgi:hypothetical protein
MNPEDFRSQLEKDLAWRQDEMRLLRNQLSSISKDEDKERYCKALVVMLYSHFEGFFKMALAIYIDAINAERITHSEASEYVAAASLADVFQDIENPNKPNAKCCDFFRTSSSEEIFPRVFRHVRVIRGLNSLLEQQVNISDNIINTESNLKLTVIQRLLYRLGFPYDTFDEYDGTIQNLLMRRNYFAHGEDARSIKEADYIIIEKKICNIMSELMIMLTKAVKDKSYLKSSVANTAMPKTSQ